MAADARPQKLDKKSPDQLYAWSKMRTKEEAAANNTSARPAPVSSSGGNGFGDINIPPGWRHDPQE